MIDIGDSAPLWVTAAAGADSVSVDVTSPTGVVRSGVWTSGGGPSGVLTIGVTAMGYMTYVTAAEAGEHAVVWTVTDGSVQTITRDVMTVTAVADMPAVSLDEVRAHLGVSSRATDEQLRSVALVATETAESYTGRRYRQSTVTESYTGHGQAYLVLLQAPFVSLTTVTIDGVAVANTQVTGTGLLMHPSGSWPGTNIGAISVTYVAGRAPTARARHGILEIVRHLWDTQRGGTQLPRQGGGGDEWDPRMSFTVPRRVAELLDHDSDVGIA